MKRNFILFETNFRLLSIPKRKDTKLLAVNETNEI